MTTQTHTATAVSMHSRCHKATLVRPPKKQRHPTMHVVRGPPDALVVHPSPSSQGFSHPPGRAPPREPTATASQAPPRHTPSLLPRQSGYSTGFSATGTGTAMALSTRRPEGYHLTILVRLLVLHTARVQTGFLPLAAGVISSYSTSYCSAYISAIWVPQWYRCKHVTLVPLRTCGSGLPAGHHTSSHEAAALPVPYKDLSIESVGELHACKYFGRLGDILLLIQLRRRRLDGSGGGAGGRQAAVPRSCKHAQSVSLSP